MFRIKAHRTKDTIYLKSGRFRKTVRATKLALIVSDNPERELICRAIIKCHELIRDRLYEKYGKDYLKHEQYSLVFKSTKSALKRMQTIANP